MTEQELLQDCLRRLNAACIPYMLVGSMAGNFWGIPRSTHDIDFVVEYQSSDVDKFMDTFQDSFFIQAASVRAALRPPHQFNALDNRSALKVDFFRLPDEAYEHERFRRRQQVSILETPAWIACAEDIVLHKLRWHTINPSDRQLKDAQGILSVSADIMDHQYLEHWAKEIGVANLLAEIS